MLNKRMAEYFLYNVTFVWNIFHIFVAELKS